MRVFEDVHLLLQVSFYAVRINLFAPLLVRLLTSRLSGFMDGCQRLWCRVVLSQVARSPINHAKNKREPGRVDATQIRVLREDAHMVGDFFLPKFIFGSVGGGDASSDPVLFELVQSFLCPSM